MSQPRISEIERPGERRLNLETLFRLAEAFDVALQVRFLPFRDFVDSVDQVHLGSFSIKPFDVDLADLENEEMWTRGEVAITAAASNQKRESTANRSDIPREEAVNSRPQNLLEMRRGLDALSGGEYQELSVVGL
jgi:transcriptional regulator with XRE-family HTH domain